MSVSGILSSNLFSYQNQNVNNNQQFQQDFAQLGQDLQSGNLTAAQSDLSTLEQLKPQATTSTQNNPVAQAFSQLSQDLQSGNLSAAQQDYTNVQQDIQKHISGTHHHIITRGAAANRVESANCFSSWARTYSRGTCRARSRCMPRFSRICSSSASKEPKRSRRSRLLASR